MPMATLVLGILGVLAMTPEVMSAADIEFVTLDLPWAIADKPYFAPPLEVRSSGACPLGGVGFSMVSGNLPPGMEFSKLGYFSGTPRRTGSWEFAVRVSNGCTWTARHYVIVVTGAPILNVTPAKIEVSGSGAAERVVQVSATWPKLSYSVTSSEEWLRAEPEQGFTPRERSALSADVVLLRVNATKLKPGRYTAKLTFTAWQAANHPVISVELTVPDRRE
jgi:hypothetical protein